MCFRVCSLIKWQPGVCACSYAALVRGIIMHSPCLSCFTLFVKLNDLPLFLSHLFPLCPCLCLAQAISHIHFFPEVGPLNMGSMMCFLECQSEQHRCSQQMSRFIKQKQHPTGMTEPPPRAVCV